ncbi:MAG: porphobilinogen synthase [Planctomycetota bacterium]
MTIRPVRPRRLRASPSVRGLVRENRVHPEQLILPLFIADGVDVREPIKTLPGVERLSVDAASSVIDEAVSLGVRSFALFPKIEASHKSADGSTALNEDGLACRALRVLRANFPDVSLVADVALDPYSSDGHDGIVRDGRVLNDETVEVLAKQAVVLAEAGANIVAPSDMMDGRVGAIRAALESTGLSDTIIMSYAAKYASSFYGPFRDALDSAPVSRDGAPAHKRTYQMDAANGDEAVREAALDVDEGADIVMVKPGLPYLDVVHRLATSLTVPVAAYHVSGEYAMLRAAASAGSIDYDDALAESLVCFVRAGARIVLTYGAMDYARVYREEHGDA